MRRLLLLTPLLLGACIAWTPRSKPVSSSAQVIDRVPMQKWGIESCGAGSLSTVLQHYGDPTSMAEWDKTLPKTHGGVLTVDMLLAARQKGFDARIVTGDRAVIDKELREGRPAILMLQVVDYPGQHFDFFHYIVADGIDPTTGLIRTQFGDGKARWVSFERLENAWAGGGHAAILIQPKDPLADAMRAAVALEDAGKYAEAAASYRSLLAAHPDSAVAWTNLGNAESRLGHRDAAEEAFRNALAKDATSRDALNNLAWLLYEEKRLDEAESLARKAVAQRGPDPYMVLDTLAHVLAAKGACAEAVTTFHEAMDAVPSAQGDVREGIANGLATSRCGAGS